MKYITPFNEIRDYYNTSYRKEKTNDEISSLVMKRRYGYLGMCVGSKPVDGEKPIIEIGCGSGNITRHLSEISIAGDISIEGLKSIRKLRKDVELIVLDAQRLPFKDDSIGAIVSSEVLEHLPDVETALSDFRRVLIKNGALALTVPNIYYYQKLQGIIYRRLSPQRFKRIYHQPIDNPFSNRSMKQILRNCHFKIITVKTIEIYPPFLWRLTLVRGLCHRLEGRSIFGLIGGTLFACAVSDK